MAGDNLLMKLNHHRMEVWRNRAIVELKLRLNSDKKE
jgi:hypothetical protein